MRDKAKQKIYGTCSAGPGGGKLLAQAHENIARQIALAFGRAPLTPSAYTERDKQSRLCNIAAFRSQLVEASKQGRTLNKSFS